MTVLEDRIAMAESDNTTTLDEMFERLEKMPVPEGYKVEIVEGTVFMSPQRDTRWEIILDFVEQLRVKYPRQRVKSDVRIDYPGHLNGFATDVTVMAEGAARSEDGRWDCGEVEFVAEVVSRGTAANDYGPKKAAYAEAEVPVYVIADPYRGECHVFSHPRDGRYALEVKADFGEELDLTGTPVGLVLKTGEFPRD
ncbi:Uma2 family endonuclease [Streptomyces sp. NPDC003273]|uniref:Uma2 family endonuclease n=1 Tax=Streptomyces sp. NPDC003273 TaxID=3364678 RepID=UPI0036B92B2E